MPSGAERWPTGAHKDVLVPMWESHCLQAPNIQADLQRNWCIPPPGAAHEPSPCFRAAEERSLVEPKELWGGCCPHLQGEPADGQ